MAPLAAVDRPYVRSVAVLFRKPIEQYPCSGGSELAFAQGMEATYFTAGDSGYFVGVVALLNSLALTRNTHRLVVIDLGFTSTQVSQLEEFADVIQLPETPRLPYFVKPLVHRIRRTDVAVWIDADIMMTRALTPLLERAAAGAICLVPDPDQDRWFPEWETLFELRAPLRRLPYCNAGFFAISTDRWGGFLDRWQEVCQSIPTDQVTADRSNPFHHTDQDAMNALVMSEVPPEALAIRGIDEEGHLHLDRDARIIDPCSLHVVRRGVPTLLLHHALSPKPWMADGWKILAGNAYVRLLPRVLFADDVPLRIDPGTVPAWLRPGRAAGASRRVAITAGRARVWLYGRSIGFHDTSERR